MRLRPLLIAVSIPALLLVGYTQRVRILDAWNERTAPTLPPPVAYEEVKQDPLPPAPVKPTPVPPVIPNEVKDPQPPVETEVPSPAAQDDKALPASINLAVPFTPQAPRANWDEFHEEACEEASLLMVHRFFEGDSGTKRLDPDFVEEQLAKMAAFEDGLFGYNADTTVAQVAALAEQMFGYERVEVLENPTREDLKKHLAAGHPIIIPAAGMELGNPYFTPPGPEYHMLVLRGYTADDKFIANDPGTRRGEEFLYPQDTVMAAMKDWNVKDQLANGPRRALVIMP